MLETVQAVAVGLLLHRPGGPGCPRMAEGVHMCTLMTSVFRVARGLEPARVIEAPSSHCSLRLSRLSNLEQSRCSLCVFPFSGLSRAVLPVVRCPNPADSFF